MPEPEFEYRLEQRYERIDKAGVSHGWTNWHDGSGYNNTNGGVYTKLSGLKSQITRSKRVYSQWGWPVEFRVLRRPAAKPPWEEFGYDA